jgi:hypothetical protein
VWATQNALNEINKAACGGVQTVHKRWAITRLRRRYSFKFPFPRVSDMLDFSRLRNSTTLRLRNGILRNPRIRLDRAALPREEHGSRITRSELLKHHTDPARAAANIANWRSYLPQDCVESMIKSGWQLSC